MACHCPILLIVRVIQLFFSLIVLAATSSIVYKFSEARQFIDDLKFLKPTVRNVANHILSTPHRIYLGMFVSVWTILVALYIVFAPRWRNAKFTPNGAIIGLEITTTGFWLCAFIGLAFFATEVELICVVADENVVLSKIIENCVILKTATAFAALSWLLWAITWITVSVQACRSRRNKIKVPSPERGLVTNTRDIWTPGQGDISKAQQGGFVTTIEMLPRNAQ